MSGAKRSVPSIATIFWPIVRPNLCSSTPYSSTNALCLHQRHPAMTQGAGEKCCWILLTYHLIHTTQGSFARRKILRHGASDFTSYLKESMLRIFIAIKNLSPRPRLNPRPLGPVTSTLTSTPPRRPKCLPKYVAIYFILHIYFVQSKCPS
jgi:hypothetical protein